MSTKNRSEHIPILIDGQHHDFMRKWGTLKIKLYAYLLFFIGNNTRDVGYLFLRMTKIKRFALNEHSWDKKVYFL